MDFTMVVCSAEHNHEIFTSPAVTIFCFCVVGMLPSTSILPFLFLKDFNPKAQRSIPYIAFQTKRGTHKFHSKRSKNH